MKTNKKMKTEFSLSYFCIQHIKHITITAKILKCDEMPLVFTLFMSKEYQTIYYQKLNEPLGTMVWTPKPYPD